MGALDIQPVAGAIYGVTRGVQDSERADREKQAFESDQAVRARQLQRADKLDELDQLNIDIGKLRKGEEEDARARAKKTLAQHDALKDAAMSLQNYDDQGAVDAFKRFDPTRFGDLKITRGDDGSITLDGGKGHPVTYRHGEVEVGNPDGTSQKNPAVLKDGTKLSPVDALVGQMAHDMDPVRQFQADYDYAQKAAVEKERTARVLGAAGIRADAAGNRQSDAWTNRQLTQIKPTLDSLLKTTGVSGSFISGYAHEDDAELRGLIEEATEAQVMQGTPVRKAARAAVDDVRTTYEKAQGLAKERAMAVAKAKIDPRDRAAVEAAAKAGNKDAQALLQVIKATEEALGPGVTKYLMKSLPAKG